MNAMLQPVANRILRDEPAEAYYVRRLDEANASGLKQMLRSPAHFRHWAEHPESDKDSPALTFGKAFHCATLEPDTFDRTYVVLPVNAPAKPTAAMWAAQKSNPESQARKDWWTDWNARNAGRIELSATDYERARRMADSVRAHPVAAGLLIGGEREITFRWQDEDTGLACKARADLYASGEFLMDLKSCRDASPEGFARAVASLHYDLQQAHYIDGIRSCGDAIQWFVFLAVESEPPYVCQPHVLNTQAEQRGVALRRRTTARQAECLRTNRWPGYSDQINELALPTWSFYGIEDTA